MLDRKFEDAFSDYMKPKQGEEEEKMSTSQRNTAAGFSTTGNGILEAGSQCSKPPYALRMATSPAIT